MCASHSNIAVKDLLDHRQLAVERRVLRQVGQAHVAGAGDAALVGRLDAGGHPQQRALAAAVHAHDADALAGLDRQGHAIQQRAVGILFADSFE